MVKIKGEVVEETINQSRVIVYFWGNCSGVEILFQAFKSAPLKLIRWFADCYRAERVILHPVKPGKPGKNESFFFFNIR